MSTMKSPPVPLSLSIQPHWQPTDMPPNTDSDLVLSFGHTIHADSPSANAIDPFTTSFSPLPRRSRLLRLPNQSP